MCLHLLMVIICVAPDMHKGDAELETNIGYFINFDTTISSADSYKHFMCKYVTGPAKTGHICTNYTCLENGSFLHHFIINTFCKVHLFFY